MLMKPSDGANCWLKAKLAGLSVERSAAVCTSSWRGTGDSRDDALDVVPERMPAQCVGPGWSIVLTGIHLDRMARGPIDDDEYARPHPPRTALKVVIGTTLVVGAVLVGILVLRTTVDPPWLRPAAVAAPTPTATSVLPPPVSPPETPTPPPPPPPATTIASVASAPSVSAPASAAPPASVASVASGAARRPRPPSNGGQPGDPEVVELPDDFRYSPPGSANLTFPSPK